MRKYQPNAWSRTRVTGLPLKPLTLASLTLLTAASALALPTEDHWTTETDPATAARIEEAARLIEAEAFAEAVPLLERLIFELPENADVYNMLGFAYRNTGDLEKSAPAYERALYLKPDHLGALEYQGELFLVLGNVEGAENNLALIEEHCAFPCEERDELAEAIATWKAENGR